MVLHTAKTRTGISDTLKREPSESVVAIAPRANPSCPSSFPISSPQKKPPYWVAFVVSGICRFHFAEPRQGSGHFVPSREPVVSFVFPDKVTTKKATLLGGICGDLIGTRTRVCAVRGRRPNR